MRGHAFDTSEKLFHTDLADPKGQPYFPKGKERYYTKIYRAAELPSMLEKREPKGQVSFRLGFIPSSTKPIFFTYFNEGGKPFIEVRRISIHSTEEGQTYGPLELSGKVPISKHRSKGLESKARKKSIRMPYREFTHEDVKKLHGIDGYTWILEVTTDQDYTMAEVPNDGFTRLSDHKQKDLGLPAVNLDDFFVFRKFILEMTDMKLPEQAAPELY